MSLIENVIRDDVRKISAYHVPSAAGLVKLDAMENPYTLPDDVKQGLGRHLAEVALNRYPVPSYDSLKEKIAATSDLPKGFGLVLGNGSDELIAMLSIACARPGAKVLAPVPGFVMYAMSAQFAGLEFVGVALKEDLTLDVDAMLAAIAEHRPAITYLAYPNNPTGTLFNEDDMVRIIRAVGDQGIVVVDEAYQPFAEVSFMPRLAEFSNLVVMRTVSKLGLAGVRLGYMSANAALLSEIDKVRPPYNVNVLTQAAVEYLFDRVSVLDDQAAQLRGQRTLLIDALSRMDGVHVFPSAGNFLLVRIDVSGLTSELVHARLLEHGVLIKNVGKMHSLLQDCVRVTVSTPEENKIFLDAFKASLALPEK